MAPSVRIPAALVVCCVGAVGAAVGTPAAAAAPTAPATPLVGRVLGGARAVALDLLWLQSDLRRTQGYTLELPALYRLITALDPSNPRAWEYHAEVLLTNLPLAAAADPDGGWRYVQEGLALLRAGLRANPDSETLGFALALHCTRLLGTDVPADWRDRATTAFGIDPLEWAERTLREFYGRAEHQGRTCALLAIVCDLRAAESGPADAERWRAEAQALRVHLHSAHGMDLSGEDSPLFDHDHDH